MSEINCNNCAVSDFKESLCHRCDEMKRLGSAEDIEGLLIKAFSEVDSPAKSDCIERQAAIDALDVLCQEHRYKIPGKRETYSQYNEAWQDALDRAEGAIFNLPPAHPELNEWCHDCKEYDKYHHCCPRWNRVIKTTLAEAQQGRTEMSSANWIPCSERLPEDYTDVLVWFEYFRYGNYNCLYQMYGIGSYSSGYNSWLINQETGWNELKVFAWMPLPEPYKGE